MQKRIIVLILTIILSFSLIGSANAQVTLDAPQNLSVKLVSHDDGRPCFELKWTNPQSIEDMIENAAEIGEAPMFYQIDYKIGNQPWDSEVNGDLLYGNSLDANQDVEDYPLFDPIDAGYEGTVDIKANIYYLRVRCVYYYCDDVEDHYIYGPFSNIVSIGTEAYQKTYSEASQWAVAELDKAVEYGFITDKIKDKMNGPITREEFCEIVVRMYESMTETKATYQGNPFNDTSNPEILKAAELGIVNGVGNNQFASNDLVTREQIGAMMYRAVGVCRPDTDLSAGSTATFTDENLISSWALDALRFMNASDIIRGVGEGRIDPKGSTTREQAVIMIVRTYEKF